LPREKQIEFPPEQTHRRDFERFMILLSVAMLAAAIGIILTFTGSFIGPWG
jgi:hypothetical protein